MYSTRITEKINPDKGAGVIFQTNNGEAVTLPRSTERDFKVAVRVTSFAGTNPFAVHVYGSLRCRDLKCQHIASKEKFTSVNQPEESQCKTIEITKIATKTIYSKLAIGQDSEARIEVAAGQHTMRFYSIYELIDAIESEFNRLFGGEPWVLYYDELDMSWEEYKKELIKLYA